MLLSGWVKTSLFDRKYLFFGRFFHLFIIIIIIRHIFFLTIVKTIIMICRSDQSYGEHEFWARSSLIILYMH